MKKRCEAKKKNLTFITKTDNFNPHSVLLLGPEYLHGTSLFFNSAVTGRFLSVLLSSVCSNICFHLTPIFVHQALTLDGVWLSPASV